MCGRVDEVRSEWSIFDTSVKKYEGQGTDKRA